MFQVCCVPAADRPADRALAEYRAEAALKPLTSKARAGRSRPCSAPVSAPYGSAAIGVAAIPLRAVFREADGLVVIDRDDDLLPGIRPSAGSIADGEAAPTASGSGRRCGRRRTSTVLASTSTASVAPAEPIRMARDETIAILLMLEISISNSVSSSALSPGAPHRAVLNEIARDNCDLSRQNVLGNGLLKHDWNLISPAIPSTFPRSRRTPLPGAVARQPAGLIFRAARGD